MNNRVLKARQNPTTMDPRTRRFSQLYCDNQPAPEKFALENAYVLTLSTGLLLLLRSHITPDTRITISYADDDDRPIILVQALHWMHTELVQRQLNQCFIRTGIINRHDVVVRGFEDE